MCVCCTIDHIHIAVGMSAAEQAEFRLLAAEPAEFRRQLLTQQSVDSLYQTARWELHRQLPDLQLSEFEVLELVHLNTLYI